MSGLKCGKISGFHCWLRTLFTQLVAFQLKNPDFRQVMTELVEKERHKLDGR